MEALLEPKKQFKSVGWPPPISRTNETLAMLWHLCMFYLTLDPCSPPTLWYSWVSTSLGSVHLCKGREFLLAHIKLTRCRLDVKGKVKPGIVGPSLRAQPHSVRPYSAPPSHAPNHAIQDHNIPCNHPPIGPTIPNKPCRTSVWTKSSSGHSQPHIMSDQIRSSSYMAIIFGWVSIWNFQN